MSDRSGVGVVDGSELGLVEQLVLGLRREQLTLHCSGNRIFGVMMSRQLVPSLVCICMLLVAALCPHYVSCKYAGGFRGRGKGVGPGGKHSSKQGLKLAGAAAAGAVGGAAIGYGLGSLGRPRYGYGYGELSEADRRYLNQVNGSNWGYYYRGAGVTVPPLKTLILLGPALCLLLWG